MLDRGCPYPCLFTCTSDIYIRCRRVVITSLSRMKLGRYMPTAVVYFVWGLLKDAVSSPDSIVAGGTMSWEGCGRKVSWPRLGYFPETPGMNEENHEKPQGGWYMNRNSFRASTECEEAALVLEPAWQVCILHPTLYVTLLCRRFTCSDATCMNSYVPSLALHTEMWFNYIYLYEGAHNHTCFSHSLKRPYLSFTVMQPAGTLLL